MYKYPYGNSEELNLDWFLNQFQSFTTDVQKKLATATVQSIIEYIAGEYDTTKNYNENDYCVYENSLYRATTSTTGVFNSDAWVIVKVSDDITTIWGELADLTTGLTNAQTTATNAATAAANAQTTATNAATAAANAQTTASNAATAAANAQNDARTALTEITPIERGGTNANTVNKALGNLQFPLTCERISLPENSTIRIYPRASMQAGSFIILLMLGNGTSQTHVTTLSAGNLYDDANTWYQITPLVTDAIALEIDKPAGAKYFTVRNTRPYGVYVFLISAGTNTRDNNLSPYTTEIVTS